MKRHPSIIVKRVQHLRSYGKTYGEINKVLGLTLAKSTLQWMCKEVRLPQSYLDRIKSLNLKNINRGRGIALEINKIKREEFFKDLKKTNYPLSKTIKDKRVAKVALAMLCLGEASKYTSKSRSFSLGNSDPRIIVIFLSLLRFCFKFDINKVRCRVQCRADQDTQELNKFWQDVTGIPERLFSRPLIDPRTIGKPTKKPNYKGVLRVDYFDTKIQHELESLADLIYNQARRLRARGEPAIT